MSYIIMYEHSSELEIVLEETTCKTKKSDRIKNGRQMTWQLYDTTVYILENPRILAILEIESYSWINAIQTPFPDLSLWIDEFTLNSNIFGFNTYFKPASLYTLSCTHTPFQQSPSTHFYQTAANMKGNIQTDKIPIPITDMTITNKISTLIPLQHLCKIFSQLKILWYEETHFAISEPI